jgi:peptidoglycan/xylan/chitin deacetylase (PgdA/CDA1 family)
MSLKKHILRNVVAPAIQSTGWFRMQAAKSNLHNLILNYHGVLDREPVRLNNRHATSVQFEQDLKYLRKHYEIVPLRAMYGQAAGSSEGKGKPKVAVTFDDGYLNNLKFALPILEKYQVPATFYIVSGALDNPDFMLWADKLDLLFHYHRPDSFEVKGTTFQLLPGGYFTGATSLWDFIKSMDKERDSWIEALTSQYPNFHTKVQEHLLQWKMMSAAEVRSCHDSGLVEIGSHTHQHYNIGQIPESLAREELAKSKQILEALVQSDVIGIGYPDGNYTDEVKNIAEEEGYLQQTAVSFRLPSDAGDARIRRRFSYSNSTSHASNMLRMEKDWNKYAF